MRQAPRVLVVDYNGIGNSFIFIPVLRELEFSYPDIYYSCTDSPVFRRREILDHAGVCGPSDLVPAIWRRFDPEHWSAITSYITDNEIEVIVNLRDEDLQDDNRYSAYREWLSARRQDIEFWDLYDLPTAGEAHQLSAERTTRMLRRHGLEIGWPDDGWLRSFGKGGDGDPGKAVTTVGFFVGASQRVKRWPVGEWVTLAGLLGCTLDSPRYLILAGLEDEEQRMASEVATRVSAGGWSAEMVKDLSLLRFVEALCGLDLLVSNDSAAVHIAAAARIPTVGLYMASLASIWGPRGAHARSLQSQIGLQCPEMKPTAGSCRLYYSGCPAPCHAGVTAGMAMREISEMLAATLTGLGEKTGRDGSRWGRHGHDALGFRHGA